MAYGRGRSLFYVRTQIHASTRFILRVHAPNPCIPLPTINFAHRLDPAIGRDQKVVRRNAAPAARRLAYFRDEHYGGRRMGMIPEGRLRMKAYDILTTLAGAVMVSASAAAGLAIRLLLTSPSSVATVMEGHDGGPLYAVVRTLYEAMSHLV